MLSAWYLDLKLIFKLFDLIKITYSEIMKIITHQLSRKIPKNHKLLFNHPLIGKNNYKMTKFHKRIFSFGISTNDVLMDVFNISKKLKRTGTEALFFS